MSKHAVTTGISLLPYLNSPASGLGLRLVKAEERAGDDFPFVLVEGSGPFTDILAAQVAEGDEADALGDYFLLVQADQYGSESTDLQPITNPQIDCLWQQAFDRYTADINRDLPLCFKEQVDDQGHLLAFQSLFYCIAKRVYCQPLCPFCGGALDVCRKDHLLKAANLPVYSASLERYLYCPHCHEDAGQSIFYSKQPAAGASAHVRGCKALVEDFSRLLVKQELADLLPCVNCEQAAPCFGSETMVHKRMLPVRFYPFFMLMQPVASLNALDFLALLSGATIEQMESLLTKRQKTARLSRLRAFAPRLNAGAGFIFENDARRFLELLYLKLCFLQDLQSRIMALTTVSSELMNKMSLEGLWVNLPAQSPRLPLYWHFSLELIDAVGRPLNASAMSQLPKARLRQFLGTCWFYALLVNARHSIQDIFKAVEPLLADSHQNSDLGAFHQIDFHQAGPVFAADNIFWQATELGIDTKWQNLWERSLGLGIDLLQAGIRADAAWSDQQFEKKLAQLKDEVREMLFITSPAAPVEDEPSVPNVSAKVDDSEIATVIDDILQQWPQPNSMPQPDDDMPQAPRTPTQLNEDGDLEETVILSAKDALHYLHSETSGNWQSVNVTHGDGKPAQQDDMQKTVILASDSAKSGQAPSIQARDNSMEKTAIIPSAETGNDLDQTIILGSSITQPPPGDSRKPLPASNVLDPDDLEATIVQSDQTKGKKR